MTMYMEKLEVLKTKIEEERVILDQLMEENKFDETYQQSLVVDKLIEEYIQMVNV